MGKHYVPRKHLERFEIHDKPGFVWMLDKKTWQFHEASISKVAQERDFYSPEIEKALADVVERPGNACLEKLLRSESLNNQERTYVTLYMLTMATRGPRQRKKSLAIAPEMLREVVANTRKSLESSIEAEPDNTDEVLALLKEVDEFEASYAERIPEKALETIRTPHCSENLLKCLHNMAWYILPAPIGKPFVTSDTPAHFFDALGIGTLESEFTFPISKNFALIGHYHSKPASIKFVPLDTSLAREVNRRIISCSDRFIFSSKNESWLPSVAQKQEPHLSLIRW